MHYARWQDPKKTREMKILGRLCWLFVVLSSFQGSSGRYVSSLSLLRRRKLFQPSVLRIDGDVYNDSKCRGLEIKQESLILELQNLWDGPSSRDASSAIFLPTYWLTPLNFRSCFLRRGFMLNIWPIGKFRRFSCKKNLYSAACLKLFVIHTIFFNYLF